MSLTPSDADEQPPDTTIPDEEWDGMRGKQNQSIDVLADDLPKKNIVSVTKKSSPLKAIIRRDLENGYLVFYSF